MDARLGSLQGRTVMVVLLGCAVALPAAHAHADTPPEPSALVIEQQPPATPEPSAPATVPPELVVEPQDPAPAVIADGGGTQVGAEAPVPEPAAQPALQAERDPQAEPGPVAATEQASTPRPAADVPDPTPAALPPVAPEVEARVAPSPTPARDKAIADRGPRLRAEVDVRLRRVEQSMERVKSQLDAGKPPADISLRELRQGFEELAPAVVALARYMASHPSRELDTGGVERRLRQAIAGAAALVAELARSGADKPESGLLVRVLEQLAGAPATVLLPGHAGTEAPSGAGAANSAYTYPAPASGRSWSGNAYETRYPAATVSQASGERPKALDLRSLTELRGPGASTNLFVGLAALALLLALAVSASLSSFLLSGWGLETSTTAPAPRRGRFLR